ncbi:MAG: sulfotransferase, partial [Bacteroidetes bacterium]
EKYFRANRFLWTHRNLSHCIPSFLSMVCHSRSIFSDRVGLEEVRDHWVKKTTYMLEKGLAYRNTGENSIQFIDILYEDLVADPMTQLERIYRPLGGISGDLRQSFRMADRENPYGKYGIHEYSLADFNLDQIQLETQNSEYHTLFKSLAGRSRTGWR